MTGKITFETQRVLAGDVPVDLDQFRTQGAAEWQQQALGENAQRAAATRAYQLAHPGKTSYSPETGLPTTGFQVREGAGGFSPSRQRPELTKSWEEVSRTESPAIQDLWLRDKQQAMALATQEGALQDVETRRRLGTAQAGLAERQLAEQLDPTLVTKGRIAAYNLMQQQLGASAAASVEMKLETARQALEAGGMSPAMIEAAVKALREKYITETAGPDAVARFNAALMGQEPSVAAAQARQTTPYGG